MKKWILKNKSADFKKMSELLDIDENLAKVLVNRDINTPKKARVYLNPTYDNFENFNLIKDLDIAKKLLKESIENNKKIMIYGDYDVDGVSSTTILYKSLKQLTNNISYYIPHREHEGYGLNLETTKKIINFNVDLLITCDNGITSIDEINLLKENNVQSIIIDHHEPIIEDEKMVLPKANAIIDPKRLDCEYPFKLMCAGGLTYRFIVNFFDFYNKELNNHEELIIFSSIATICDIVDLYEDNRIIVKNGLDLLNNFKNINKGLYALLEKNSIHNKNISDYDVGFIIGPCINAVGRLDKATLAVDLFTTDDDELIEILSTELYELNTERKKITKESFDRVLEKVQNDETYLEDDILVVYDEETHESVAGIVAGRLKDYFYKPTIVLTNSSKVAKGSARSIPNCDIYKLLSKSRELFLKFGGHSMAAGLSLDFENIEKLRLELNKNSELEPDDFIEIIKIENQLSVDDITLEKYYSLEKLKPFGKGNREPLFGSKNVFVSSIRVIEEKNTIIFTFEDKNSYKKLKGIYFSNVDYFKKIILEKYEDNNLKNILKGNLNNINLVLDIIYSIQINEYNNNISVQALIKDMRIS